MDAFFTLHELHTPTSTFEAIAPDVSASDDLMSSLVTLQQPDGKNIGSVIKYVYDARRKVASMKVHVNDPDTYNLLANGCLTGVAVHNNLASLCDRPVSKTATFALTGGPITCIKSFALPQPCGDPFRFGNASKSPYLSYWDRQHPTPEVSKRAAAPRKHQVPFPETTGFPSGVHRDLTDEYALALAAGALRQALRRATRTSHLAGCSRQEVVGAAHLSKGSPSRPSNPAANQLAYQNANQRLIEGEAEPPYIPATATRAPAASAPRYLPHGSRTNPNVALVNATLGGQPTTVGLNANFPEVSAGVASKFAKVWSDEARAAALAARQHGWQLKHAGERHIELQHPGAPSHRIIYENSGKWQHTVPASNSLFGRVKAEGQGIKSLETHLHEYHDIVPRSQRGASGSTRPANPYYHEKG